MHKVLLFLSFLLFLRPAGAQTNPRELEPFLKETLQSREVTSAKLNAYLMKKVPKLVAPATGGQWTAEANRIRKAMLTKIIFHGWPREWVNGPLKVEDLGLIPSGKGYRIRKLRYEIVPGFYTTALLYEPEVMKGKMPAILNVNGHVGPLGKAIEYKQKRCINQALRGILALNVEWLAFGELNRPGNSHWFAAHLNLVGANGVGLFYLAMRKGLDYLYQNPHVDRSHIGMTGLSGGGWQTIVLSSLDKRVWAAAPVAGYSTLVSRIERGADTGDLEQNPTDMLTVADYSQLTAMRAPRPTLLIYDAEDNCCFRGPLVKPYVFDRIRPFFRLYNHADRFGWHLNTDPSTHNYQIDNREASYRFFTKSFGLPVTGKEIPVDAEIKSYDQLVVGLPKDNLTILGLAREMAGRIERPVIPSGSTARREWARHQRARLKVTVRYHPVEVAHAWALHNSYEKGLETRSYRLEFTNSLGASVVWFKALAVPASVPATIVLNDKGKEAAAADISDRVNRGERVLAFDPLFTGAAKPQRSGTAAYAQMLATTGDRPLGMEAAQLIGAAHWLRKVWGAPSIRLETSGIRSQVIALTAAALEPELFNKIVVRNGMASLSHLLDAPVKYLDAPDLFCLDFYKNFDLPSLEQIAGRTRVVRR